MHAEQVRSRVRPRQKPADFLREWGATTVQADLGSSLYLCDPLAHFPPLLADPQTWELCLRAGALHRAAATDSGRLPAGLGSDDSAGRLETLLVPL